MSDLVPRTIDALLVLGIFAGKAFLAVGGLQHLVA